MLRSESQIVVATRRCVRGKAKLCCVVPKKAVTDGETLEISNGVASQSNAFGAMFVTSEKGLLRSGVASNVIRSKPIARARILRHRSTHKRSAAVLESLVMPKSKRALTWKAQSKVPY